MEIGLETPLIFANERNCVFIFFYFIGVAGFLYTKRNLVPSARHMRNYKKAAKRPGDEVDTNSILIE